MKLYETSTPGEYLGLQFDVLELRRFFQEVESWRRVNPAARAGYKFMLYQVTLGNDIKSTIRLEAAFASIAKAIDDGQIDAVKSARIWGRFRVELGNRKAEWGTTLTGYPVDGFEEFDGAPILETPILEPRETLGDKVVFSKPLAECLKVYRVRNCVEWGALDLGGVDLSHGVLSPTLPPTDDATIKARLEQMRLDRDSDSLAVFPFWERA